MIKHLLLSYRLTLIRTTLAFFFTLLAAVFVPLGTAFELDKTAQSVFKTLLYSVYGVFWLDLFFSTATEVKAVSRIASDGRPPSTPEALGPYLWSGCFWLDLLASIPFDFFIDAGLLRLNTLVKVPSLCQSIARSFVTQGTGGHRSNSTPLPFGSSNSKLLQRLKLSLLAVVFVHSAVCVWLWLSRKTADNWLRR